MPRLRCVLDPARSRPQCCPKDHRLPQGPAGAFTWTPSWRFRLTIELGALESDTKIAESLRALRLACRKFLNLVGEVDGPYVRFGAERGHYASWTFNVGLGLLRGAFGVQIARMAASYGLDVEDDLAAILPETDDDAASPSNQALQRTVTLPPSFDRSRSRR